MVYRLQLSSRVLCFVPEPFDFELLFLGVGWMKVEGLLDLGVEGSPVRCSLRVSPNPRNHRNPFQYDLLFPGSEPRIQSMYLTPYQHSNFVDRSSSERWRMS